MDEPTSQVTSAKLPDPNGMAVPYLAIGRLQGKGTLEAISNKSAI